MPNNNSCKHCQICGKAFPLKDLHPLIFLQPNALKLALKKYPHLERAGFICYPDLRKISAMRFEELLRQEKGELSELEEEVLQSLKQHDILTENTNEEFEEQLTLGERLADKIAQFGGSWTFLTIFGVVIFGWMALNTYELLKEPFDPYPYILLNLVLSCLAAVQAPVIMMSQNRHAAKDRLTQENDYQVNLKSELQVRQLNTRLELFMKDYWENMHRANTMHEEILSEIRKGSSEHP